MAKKTPEGHAIFPWWIFAEDALHVFSQQDANMLRDRDDVFFNQDAPCYHATPPKRSLKTSFIYNIFVKAAIPDFSSLGPKNLAKNIADLCIYADRE